MNFNFDHNKSAYNKQHYGINFEEAQRLWLDFRKVEIDALTLGTCRKILIAKYNKDIWSAMFTIRMNEIRLISVRKSNQNEKEIYYSTKIG